MSKRKGGKLTGGISILMGLILSFLTPVSSLADAQVTYKDDIPVKIVLSPYTYEAVPSGWGLSGTELNTDNLKKVAQNVIREWAPLAFNIFRWGRNEGATYSGVTANIPDGASWDTYFNESEANSWKIKLENWLAASDSKTKGETESDYSHRTGIMSASSLNGLREAMADEIRTGLGKSHYTIAEVLEDGGGDKGALCELNDTKNRKIFYNIVTHLNNQSGSIYYYNSYGIAVYDFEMTPIVDPNVEYRDSVKTTDPNGTNTYTNTSYSKNESAAEGSVAVSHWDQVDESVMNEITNSESISLTETIHNEFNFGSDNAFFKDSLQIEISATQVMETARTHQEVKAETQGGQVEVSTPLPPQTGVRVDLEKKDMTTYTKYTCPVALRYKVAIFSMSGHSSAHYINGTVSNFSTIFGFGNEDGGYGAPENLYQRAVYGNNNDHSSNDASYGQVNGWYDKQKYLTNMDWAWILNRTGADTVRRLATTIPLFGQGASMKVVTNGKFSTVGPIMPLYPLKEVRLEAGEEDYELFVGDVFNTKNLEVGGYNDKGVPYFNFDSKLGSWVLCDSSGKETVSSSVAKLEVNSNTGKSTLTALRPGTVYLKYKIDEKKYGTLEHPETYATNASLMKTAMVEINIRDVPVKGVKLDETQLEMTAGETTVLTATVEPDNAANKNVTWASSKTNVAAVSQDGKVTAKTAGSAKITVTTQDGNKSAVCYVTVEAKTYKVTFVDGQGKTLATRAVKEGEAAKAPTDPTRDGFTFKGWDKDFEDIQGDITVTALWKEQTSSKDGKSEVNSEKSEAKNEKSEEKPVITRTSEKQILKTASKKEAAGSTFTLLQLRGKAASGTSVKLTWKKVSGAGKYEIYGCKFGGKLKKIGTVAGTSYTQKKLKKGKYYKYIVAAVNGSKTLAISRAVYVGTKGGKAGNYSSVKLSTTSLTLKAGKSKKITAALKRSAKKMTVFRKVAWESSNVRVATVKNGKIKAVKKGSCYIYAYAQDGTCAKIKVKVKKK